MPLPLAATLDTLARMAVGVVALLWWLPRFALPAFPDLGRADRVILGGAAGALALVVAGYALAAAHLYEWMTLAAVLVGGAYLARSFRPRRYAPTSATGTALAELDRLQTLPGRAARTLAAALRGAGSHLLPTARGAALGLVAAAILGVGVWMRWWMQLRHAAPFYSDFVVVLVWVKQIEEQHLFPDGVYLKGFHLVLSGLQKLTLAPPDVFVKYAGPAIGTGMLLSVAHFTHRLTGRVAPALLAALVYGTLPHLLPYEAARQAATDSQEFGNMLVLPAAWFVYAAWTRPASSGHRLGAALLLTLIATVHPIALVNAAAAAAAATVAAAAAAGPRGRTAGGLGALLAGGAALAALPPAVGLALGAGFYASSVQFAIGSAAVAPPLLPATLAAAAAALLATVALAALFRRRAALGPPLLALLLLGFAVALRQAPRFGIENTALAARSGELVALAVPPALAMGWSALEEGTARLIGTRAAGWLSLAALAAVAAASWAVLPPRPFSAYQIDPDELVAAYVRIEDTTPATDWLAVSDQDGYDYALGSGYFLNPAAFLQHVAPAGPWPSYRNADGTAHVVGEDHIFIFVEKRFWVAPLPAEQARLPARQAASAALQNWVAAWRAQGGQAQVFMDGQYLRVYELSRVASAQDNLQRLFGTGGG